MLVSDRLLVSHVISGVIFKISALAEMRSSNSDVPEGI